MKKLVLIDGNAIIHRAFHALPLLNNKDGMPTNAVYGFFMMLLKIVEDLQPEYLIVCFDKAAPTFRKQLYVGYQATRPKISDDLSPQFAVVHKALDEAKIIHFEVDGYEADDLIGTISKEAKAKDLQTIIVSGDRDLLQLVNGKVLMLAPIIGMTKMTLFDETKVREKYGLEPWQIVDYKALVGDASDNYPGVSGIGPKTASGLLNKYQTLEGIYQHLGELSPQVQEKLAQDAEQAALAKKLATIVLDAPVKLDETEAEITKIDKAALKKVFEELNFKSLLNRLAKESHKVIKVQSKSKEKKEAEEQLGLL
ncbi:MAG TPA: 5'-3' exonuclease H3TH domain-containing protein [Patescibacteria group bacterium]|jgi:DNA polymerase-1|nr:5'-3' exonuclease H3TH domain-containing protein [Patescibacteria group bacterium]